MGAGDSVAVWMRRKSEGISHVLPSGVGRGLDQPQQELRAEERR